MKIFIFIVLISLILTSCFKEVCSPNPCQNNGTCSENIVSYKCLCSLGFTGDNCEETLITCIDNPCQNGGECTDLNNSYTCSCISGYNGTNCENNIDDCVNHTCVNGNCVDEVESYSCDCFINYTGSNCTILMPGCGNGVLELNEECDDNNLINEDGCSDLCKSEIVCGDGIKEGFEECDDENLINEDGCSDVCKIEGKAFITTWKTDNESIITNEKQVKIWTVSSETYDYNIDCDSDGIIEATNQTGDYICEYSELGIYTISITGIFPRIHFDLNIESDNYKIVTIEQWGSQKWTSMENAFAYCSNLTINARDLPDLSNVKSMSNMLSNVKSINQNISYWNVNNVTDMSRMFSFNKSFNQDLSLWNVSNVSDMDAMFLGASSFDQDLASWNVKYVKFMRKLFSGAESFNKDISIWNVASVTDMSFMFEGANSFNQDLSLWDVSQVAFCTSFNDGATLWSLPKPNFISCNINP